MAQRQIGPFLVEGQLGAGGMGIVYLATYTPTGKKVALKVLTPSLSSDTRLLRRFEREIDILKRMSHPNIVKYYGGGTENHQRYYAMEFIDGGSLQDILRKKRRLNWEQAIQVGRQLCSALEHAHNAGIVHRDLKPANLFITRRGKLKLGDFGIARDTEATALTAAGKTVGTYAYMAPEQIHGNAAISRKTDLYATGCLLFETLTGETPFVADNPAEMLIQHLNDDPRNVREVVSDCPIWLDELIERLMAKNPDDRPYDALAVHTELTEMLNRLKESRVVSAAGGDAARFSTISGNAEATADPTVPKKKSKKKKKEATIFEQTWFLLACLLLLLGGAAWLAMPPGENSLYLSSRKAWESRDDVTQREGRDRYMLPYLQRFPDGRYREDIHQWADQIQVNVLEAQAEKRAKGNREPRDDYEAAYLTAYAAETDRERNPLEAIELLHQLTLKFRDDPETVHWGMLVNRRLENAKQRLLAHSDRDQLIRTRMLTAERLLRERRYDEAAAIWYHFREVFYTVREVENYYLYARRRSYQEPAELPPLSQREATAETAAINGVPDGTQSSVPAGTSDSGQEAGDSKAGSRR